MNELALTAIDAAADQTAFPMDEDRFRLFYNRTARKVWCYLARVSGDPALADDLLQEAYYRFLRARLASGDEAYLQNYLFRIATNLLRDHWRSRKHQGTPVEASESAGQLATDEAYCLEQKSDLDRALGQLKPREREMLWLAYVMGSNHNEIAGALGIKSKSVRLSLFRARRKLAALLGRSSAPSIASSGGGYGPGKEP